MDSRVLAILSVPTLLAVGSTAAAQIQDDDILLNLFDPATSAVDHYRPNGTHVVSTSGGTGHSWEGASVTDSGRIVTTRRGSYGFNLFDVSGSQVDSHNTPAITGGPADVSVFQDGTLAICDQNGRIRLFLEDGTFLQTFTQSMGIPVGNFVDSEDNLWVADIQTPGQNNGKIWKFDRSGVLLDSFNTAFETSDLVVPADGTIWVTDRIGGNVMHLSSTGTVLGSFPTVITSGGFNGLGMSSNGSLYVTGENESNVYRYTQAGALVGQFAINSSGKPLLLTVVDLGLLGDNYCIAVPNSTGFPALISAMGSTSVAANNLFLSATPVPFQPGLFFYGPDQIQVPFGNGFRCVGGFITRLPPQVPSGDVLSHLVDNTMPPTLMGQITAGQTLQFQAWFRDPAAGGGLFNLSDGLELSFTP